MKNREWEALVEAADLAHLDAMAELREALMHDLALGHMETTLRLPTLVWLDILDEVADRRARNYTQLLRDDTLDRLNAAIDRLHNETVFMAANGPGAVAERAAVTVARQGASPQLRQLLRDQLAPDDKQG